MRDLLFAGEGGGADRDSVEEFQRGTHLPLGAPARELGRERPEVDTVFVTEGLGAETVLLVVVPAAKADAKDVVRPLTSAGIRGRAQMRKVDIAGVATRHATAMRFDPAPMPWPNLLQSSAHAQLWPLQPVGQPHERLSQQNGSSGLIGAVTIAIARS